MPNENLYPIIQKALGISIWNAERHSVWRQACSSVQQTRPGYLWHGPSYILIREVSCHDCTRASLAECSRLIQQKRRYPFDPCSHIEKQFHLQTNAYACGDWTSWERNTVTFKLNSSIHFALISYSGLTFHNFHTVQRLDEILGTPQCQSHFLIDQKQNTFSIFSGFIELLLCILCRWGF